MFNIESEENIPKHVQKQLKKLVSEANEAVSKEKAAKREADMAKSALKMFVETYKLEAAHTEEVDMYVVRQKRFKAYKDEEAVKALIPEDLRPKCMSLNRKAIQEYIKKGDLPQAIQDLEETNEVISLKFQVPKEE